MKGGIHSCRDTGKEGFRTGGIQVWRDAGKEGFMAAGIQERRVLGLQGFRTGGIQCKTQKRGILHTGIPRLQSDSKNTNYRIRGFLRENRVFTKQKTYM